MRSAITRLTLLLAALLCAWPPLTSAAMPSGTMMFEFGAGNLYDFSRFRDCKTEREGGSTLTLCLDVDMVPNGKGRHTGTASFDFSGFLDGNLAGPASGAVSGIVGGKGEASLKMATSGKLAIPDYPELGKLKTTLAINCSGKINAGGRLATVCKIDLDIKGIDKIQSRARFSGQLPGEAWALTIDMNPVSAKKFTGAGTDSLGYIYKVVGLYDPVKDTSEVDVIGKGAGRGAFVELKRLTDSGAAKAKFKVQGYRGGVQVQASDL